VQEEVKPRIKRYAGCRWECRDDSWIGFGSTPRAAYEFWIAGASLGPRHPRSNYATSKAMMRAMLDDLRAERQHGTP
jgi:NAD(P)-dependent dehydrogenase (short-subunit alcohol dehydrogenase family)